MIQRLILAAALLALPLSADQDNSKVEGSLADINWGAHWGGTQLKTTAELKGKVTLLVIWGG